VGEGEEITMPNFPNRCQHIKVNGTQCGCPALRRNKLCYFHKRHHEERLTLNADRARRRRNVTIDLPVLEDANAIQVSLMQIMRLLVAGQIEGKTAGLLLYALQTASANLSRTMFEPYIRSIVVDPANIAETRLGAQAWDDSDFASGEEDDEEDEVGRVEALERSRNIAKRKAELEAEADRITEEGRRQRAAAARNQAASSTAKTLPAPSAVTPAARAVSPPPQAAPSLGKRPPSNVNMDEVRKQLRDQIINALPAIVAAQSSREKARRENGSSGG
jgi:hypothetical protein